MRGRARRRAATILLIAVTCTAAAFTADGPRALAASGHHTITGFAVSHYAEGDSYDLDLDLYTRLPGGQLHEEGRAQTDDIGNFSFSVLDGTYYLYASPPGVFDGLGLILPGWYLHTPFDDAATPIVVTGGDVHLQSFELDPTPRISGTVVDEGGRPVLGAGVSLVTYQGDFTGTDPGDVSLVTGSDGTFRLWGGGKLALKVHDEFEDSFAPEWYLNQSWSRDATPISVVHDTQLPPLVVGPGGSITGTATDDHGRPVRHVAVSVTRADEPQQYDAAPGQATDVNGHYRFQHLAPGTYQLTFDTSFDYEPTTTTARVEVSAHATTTFDVGFARHDRPHPTGPFIQGRLIDGQGRPVYGVSVYAADPADPSDDPRQMTVYGSTYTDPDGVYRIPVERTDAGKPAVLFFQDNWHADDPALTPHKEAYDLDAAFYPGGVRHMSDATHVTVPAERLDLPDTTMRELAGITGTVLVPTDPIPAGPMYGYVGAYDDDGNCVESVPIQRNGRYYLDRLPAGTYRLWFGSADFLDEEGPYLPNWWQGGTSFETATPVTIRAGQTLTGISATVVPRARTVVGTMVDPTGRPVGGVYISTRVIAGNGYTEHTYSDPDGRFRLTFLPGQYKIRFGASDDLRFRELWYGGGNSQSSASVLTVPEGQPPLDLGPVQVAPYPVVSGRVTDATGRPVTRTLVTAYLPDGTASPASTINVGDGSYRLRLPDGGTYRIGYSPHGESPPVEYYHEAPSLTLAAPLTIGANQQVSGIDEVLLPTTGTPTPTPIPTPTPTPTPSPSTPPAPSLLSHLRIRTHERPAPRRRDRAVVLATRVVVPGLSSSPEGTVVVMEHGRVIGSWTLRRGRTVALVPHPRLGVHRYDVFYQGSPLAAPTMRRVRVRVT